MLGAWVAIVTTNDIAAVGAVASVTVKILAALNAVFAAANIPDIVSDRD